MEKKNEVDDWIYSLEEEMFPNMDFTFLSMTKTLEVTREHYPKFAKGENS